MERGREGCVFPIHRLKISVKNMLPLSTYSPTKGVIKKRVTYYPTLIPLFTNNMPSQKRVSHSDILLYRIIKRP